MRPWHRTCLGIVAIALLTGSFGDGAFAQVDAPPSYTHAQSITFEPVEAWVWRVIDPAAPKQGDADYPEWHQGVEVAPDGRVWVWGPGGIRTLGGEPIGDDPAEWEASMSGVISKASGLAVSTDGAVWANIDSQVRSFDGTGWTTHQLDWASIAPPGADGPTAVVVRALPDGSVWATWQVWYDDGYMTQTALASFEDGSWTEHASFRDVSPVVSVGGNADGDTWVGGSSAGPTSLMHRVGHGWEAVELPSDPGWPVLAVATDGAVWTTVVRPDDPDGCLALARLVDGVWSLFVPDRSDMCAFALFGLEAAPDGSIWFAGSGVTAVDGGVWRHYLEEIFALDLDIAPDGSVWVAAAEGLFVIRPPKSLE